MISQSGGVGFAFFDRARARNLSFRHIVTTGNEAALEVSDFVDYMLDEGKTDVFLAAAEAVKSPEKFKRVAEKALKAGKPLIVGKIGQTEPGRRAVASHTAALAGSTAAYRAVFEHYGLIEGRDFDEMIDLAAGFLACGDELPAGNRVGICTSSGGAGVWMADACAAAGLEVPMLDARDAQGARRASALLRHVAEPGRFHSARRAQTRLCRIRAARRSIAVDRRRHRGGHRAAFGLSRRRFAETQGRSRAKQKPVFMWTYTLPAERSVEILNEAGYPLFTDCARLRAARCRRWPIIAQCVSDCCARSRQRARRRIAQQRGAVLAAAPGHVLCEWHAQGRCSPPTALAPRAPAQLAHSARRGRGSGARRSAARWR